MLLVQAAELIYMTGRTTVAVASRYFAEHAPVSCDKFNFICVANIDMYTELLSQWCTCDLLV